MRPYRPLALSPRCLNSGRVASSPILRHGLKSNNINTKTLLLNSFTPLHTSQATIRHFHFSSSNFNAHKMSSSLIPANPADLMVIRNVTPNIVTFSVPFARFGRIQIGGRGTLGMSHHSHIIRLSVLNVSPTPVLTVQ